MPKLNFSWACQTTAGPCDTETALWDKIFTPEQAAGCVPVSPAAPQHHCLDLLTSPRAIQWEISTLNGFLHNSCWDTAQVAQAEGAQRWVAVVVTQAEAPTAGRKGATLPRQSTPRAPPVHLQDCPAS